MTAYNVWLNDADPNAGEKLALKAGAYELRITAILSSNSNVWIDRYPNASISGGSVVPVVPFREGAPAASATARYGSVSVTGGASAQFGINWAQKEPRNFPFDFTVAPGSVLTLALTGDSTLEAYYGIAFEELLLAWHY